MRALSSFINLLIAATLAASLLSSCGGDDPGHEGEDVDAEGCEHLSEGPYTPIAAATERSAAAPAVGADHMAYSISLPAGAAGHVTFAVDAAGEHVLFFDQAVTVKVFSASGTEVPIEASAPGSDACDEVKGRHTIDLAVGTHILEISAAGSLALVNLVIEEAGGHADE